MTVRAPAHVRQVYLKAVDRNPPSTAFHPISLTPRASSHFTRFVSAAEAMIMAILPIVLLRVLELPQFLYGRVFVATVAAVYGCIWNICRDAVVATADPVLDTEPNPVTVLGIDETHRGKARLDRIRGRRWMDVNVTNQLPGPQQGAATSSDVHYKPWLGT
jgi:hypothetical protein